MPSIHKLPSGNWRSQVYFTQNGKTIRKSFTARTKQEALELAYTFTKEREKYISDITVSQAIKNYIESSTSTLSPSTIAEYKRCAKLRYDLINDIPLSEISSADMRKLINQWGEKGLSSKTIKNCYNLAHASIKMYRPDIAFQVTMPKKQPKTEYIPTDEDIKILLEAAKGTDIEIPIMLAAYCSMRRGEIAALTTEDYYDGLIHINKSVVRDEHGDWIVKSPKTPAGYRTVRPPQRLAELLANLPEGKVTTLNPTVLFKRFRKVREGAGLPPFRFHALRHYFASSLHFAGVPDKYIMKMGGWESMSVLQGVYQHALEDKKSDMMDFASSYFDEK